MPNIPEIKQLAIYDIAIHVAFLQSESALMPKAVVYIHALPMSAYNWLVSKGFLKGLKKNTPQVSYKVIGPYFKGLDAFQIEDLLCQLGKSIRRVKNGKSPRNEIEEEIDCFVRKHA